MDNTNHPFPDDDARIEFTDLDSTTHNRTFHEFRFSPRVRIWMVVVTVISVVLFLSFTFGSQLYSLVYRPQPPKISISNINVSNSTSPSAITLETVMDGVVYAVDPDRMFYAIRASNGSLIWQSFTPDISWSTTSAGITYTVKQNEAVIVAQGKGVNPLWIYHSPSPIGPATVVGNHIYIVTNDDTIDALDTTYGNLLWHYHIVAHIAQSPIFSGEFVSINSEIGTLFTFRASDGALLWHQQLPSDAQVFTTNGNIIYASNNSITALHSKDGSLAWHLNLSSTPVQPLVTAYGNIYIATFDGNMSVFNGSTGSLLWRRHLPSLAYESIAISDTMVYIHTSDYTLYTLNAMNGSLLWSKPVTNVFTFVVVDGIAYIITMTSEVEALHPTGAILWQRQLPSTAIRPLIVSNGVLFTGSASGTIYAVRARDNALLWHYATQVQ